MEQRRFLVEISDDSEPGDSAVQPFDRQLAKLLAKGKLGTASLDRMLRWPRILGMALWSSQIEPVLRAQKAEDLAWRDFEAAKPELLVKLERSLARLNKTASEILGQESVQKLLWSQGPAEATKAALAAVHGTSMSTVTRLKRDLAKVKAKNLSKSRGRDS